MVGDASLLLVNQEEGNDKTNGGTSLPSDILNTVSSSGSSSSSSSSTSVAITIITIITVTLSSPSSHLRVWLNT
ncbi:hypothetical protein E2C01_071461 [Portunus trituberculatus]|uniref:Uncharacterized protein n=1 Tax=Portunus trituberculatus TaxID=210409 RepID=A0A5B7I013_PORTR|nr:hypothetical protein [Portunus trituberculatus]